MYDGGDHGDGVCDDGGDHGDSVMVFVMMAEMVMAFVMMVVIFLQHLISSSSGKTTLVNQLNFGQAVDTLPTVGLNVTIMKKNNVKMKV